MPQPNDLSRSLGSKLYWSALRITETADLIPFRDW
jgi:hypothetical protein